MNPAFAYALATLLFYFINQATSIRCPELSIRHGRVRYRSRGRVAIYACWLGYTLYGEKYAGCFRGSWDVPPPKCVKKGCKEKNLPFGTVRSSLNSAVLSFRCFPGYTLTGPREIYCDGSVYDNNPPTCAREETDITCDFENQRLCKWRNDPSANLTFHLRQQATPSRVLNTGPDHDHTLDPETDGYYLYLESSSTNPGEVARLYSPYLPHATDDNTCFRFWYHMYGSTIGALRVYVNETVVFERKGNRGDRWRLGKVKLPTTVHFKIVIEAVTGIGYTGDIAVDDLDKGKCSDDAGTTCMDRCSEDESDEYSTCDCHPGCVDQTTCCADFNHYCVAETPEVAESTTPAIEITSDLAETSSDIITIESDTILYDTTLSDDITNEVSLETETSTDDSSETQTEITEMDLEPTTIDTADKDNTDFKIELITIPLRTYSTHNITKNESTTSLPSTTHEVNKTSVLNIFTNTKSDLPDSTTHRYNLRPRTSVKINTMSTSTKFPPTSKPTNNTVKQNDKSITNPAITVPTTTVMKSTNSTYTPLTTYKIFTPVGHQPVTTSTVSTMSTSKTTSKRTTTPPTKPTFISTKDPKITTRLVIRDSTESNPDRFLTLTTKTQMTRVEKVNDTIAIDSEQTTPSQTDITARTGQITDSNIQATKWKTKYKAKGSYQLVEEDKAQTAGYDGWTMIFATVFIIIVLAGTAFIAILFIRKRRLSSGPSDDGADILFIPSDEMLDFTPSLGRQNRDSGVYSETVTSLKRGK